MRHEMGRRFEFCRNLTGLSQNQAAKKLGIGQSSLSAYESGDREPGMTAICRMADLYGVSSDFLLKRTDKTDLANGGFISVEGRDI